MSNRVLTSSDKGFPQAAKAAGRLQNRPTIKHEKNTKPTFAADCRTLAGIPPALILLAPTLRGVAVIAMASALGHQEIEALLIDMLG